MPGFMSGEYRLNARWISSYERNLRELHAGQFHEPSPRNAGKEDQGANAVVHGPHVTPEQQRRAESVPQALPSAHSDNLLRAVDRTRVQFRTGHLHLEARLQVLGWARDEADGLACEESRDLVFAA